MHGVADLEAVDFAGEVAVPGRTERPAPFVATRPDRLEIGMGLVHHQLAVDEDLQMVGLVVDHHIGLVQVGVVQPEVLDGEAFEAFGRGAGIQDKAVARQGQPKLHVVPHQTFGAAIGHGAAEVDREGHLFGLFILGQAADLDVVVVAVEGDFRLAADLNDMGIAHQLGLFHGGRAGRGQGRGRGGPHGIEMHQVAMDFRQHEGGRAGGRIGRRRGVGRDRRDGVMHGILEIGELLGDIGRRQGGADKIEIVHQPRKAGAERGAKLQPVTGGDVFAAGQTAHARHLVTVDIKNGRAIGLGRGIGHLVPVVVGDADAFAIEADRLVLVVLAAQGDRVVSNIEDRAARDIQHPPAAMFGPDILLEGHRDRKIGVVQDFGVGQEGHRGIGRIDADRGAEIAFLEADIAGDQRVVRDVGQILGPGVEIGMDGIGRDDGQRLVQRHDLTAGQSDRGGRDIVAAMQILVVGLQPGGFLAIAEVPFDPGTGQADLAQRPIDVAGIEMVPRDVQPGVMAVGNIARQRVGGRVEHGHRCPGTGRDRPRNDLHVGKARVVGQRVDQNIADIMRAKRVLGLRQIVARQRDVVRHGVVKRRAVCPGVDVAGDDHIVRAGIEIHLRRILRAARALHQSVLPDDEPVDILDPQALGIAVQDDVVLDQDIGEAGRIGVVVHIDAKDGRPVALRDEVAGEDEIAAGRRLLGCGPEMDEIAMIAKGAEFPRFGIMQIVALQQHVADIAAADRHHAEAVDVVVGQRQAVDAGHPHAGIEPDDLVVRDRDVLAPVEGHGARDRLARDARRALRSGGGIVGNARHGIAAAEGRVLDRDVGGTVDAERRIPFDRGRGRFEVEMNVVHRDVGGVGQLERVEADIGGRTGGGDRHIGGEMQAIQGHIAIIAAGKADRVTALGMCKRVGQIGGVGNIVSLPGHSLLLGLLGRHCGKIAHRAAVRWTIGAYPVALSGQSRGGIMVKPDMGNKTLIFGGSLPLARRNSARLPQLARRGGQPRSFRSFFRIIAGFCATRCSLISRSRHGPSVLNG